MKQLLAMVIVFWCARVVCAQENALPFESSDTPVAELELLEILMDTQIPGEVQQVDAADEHQMESLLGKTVVSIVAEAPPAGFDPVDDTQIPLGVRFTRQVARQAVLNLWETGNYREIKISGQKKGKDGIVLFVSVEPMFRIGKVVMTGNKAMDQAELKRAIAFVPGGTISPDTESMIKLRDKLLDEYKRRGYTHAKATMRLETTDKPGEVVLLVDVDEGKPDVYGVIELRGLTDDLDESELLRKSKLRKGVIKDQLILQQRLNRLVDILIGKGYLDAKLDKTFTITPLDKHRFKLIVTVYPGLKTTTSFIGNHRLRKRYLEEELTERGTFTSSAAAISHGVSRLTEYGIRKGLLHIQVSARRRCFSSATASLLLPYTYYCPTNTLHQELVFKIQEGPSVEVDEIFVQGNHHFSEMALKNEIYAYMIERNTPDETFEQLSGQVLDEVTTSSKDTMAAKPSRGSKAPIKRPERIYVPELYKGVKEHLAGLYMEKGFLSAQIIETCDIENQSPREYKGRMFFPFSYESDSSENEEESVLPCLYIDKSLDGLIVEFRIEEGPQTRIAHLSVTGNTPDVFTEKALYEIGNVSLNQPFNEYNIREAAQKIRTEYQNRGFMFADVSWQTSVSMDATAAEVSFVIKEGPLVTVNEIVINAEITKKWLIKDNIGIKEGAPITPRGLVRAEQRLMDMGIFNAVTVQMQSPQTVAPKKNVVVTVIERKPQFLELRAGVATEEGVRGGFQYGHRNMFGLGLSYRLKMRANYRLWFIGEQAGALQNDIVARYEAYKAETESNLPDMFRYLEWYVLMGVKSTHLPGTKGVLGTGIDVVFENINKRGYSALKVSPYYRLTSNYLRYLPIELKTGLEMSIVIPSLNPEWEESSRLPWGQAQFWVTSLSISLDFRDNPFNPHKGIFASVTGDFVQSVPVDTDDESQYFRFLTTLSGYIPFGNNKNVVALSISSGYIFHMHHSVAWADRYFYMGGVNSLRGFAGDTVVPQDIYYLDEDDPTSDLSEEYGGEAMFLIRSELRHDFGSNIIGVVFGEAGNIWRDTGNYLRNKTGKFAPYLLRPVAGVGLHYNTPVGPIAFDVGINLNKRDYESRSAWHFSIGSAF